MTVPTFGSGDRPMFQGSLTDYLRSRGRSVIKRTDQYAFSWDVSKAMVYLESKSVIHRSIF